MITHLRFARRHAMARLSRRAALAVTLACAAAGTAAATESWTGVTSADWSDKTNWNGNAVPGFGDTVDIDTIAPNATVLGNGVTTLKIGPVTLGSVSNGKGGLTVSAASHLVTSDFQAGKFSGTTGTVNIHGNSSLAVGNDVYIGNQGTGTLNIGAPSSGPGTVMDTNGRIGSGNGGIGQVTVNGVGSTWTNFGLLGVGTLGTGVLTISNGGSVTDDSAWIGNQPVAGSTSSVAVSDPGSSWTSTGSLSIGISGAGQLQIANGASVSSNGSNLGEFAGGTGLATIDQAGSKWTDVALMTIGDAGSGNLGVSNGGTVGVGRAILGNAATGTGNVLVDSGASFTVTNDLIIAQQGNAGVTLSNGGTLKVSGMPYLGTASGTGSLNIGNGASSFGVGLTPKPPGVLNVPVGVITIGSSTGGNGTLVFNHTGTNYVFTPGLTEAAGNMGGTIQAIAGTTSMTGDSSSFAGGTFVFGGTLLVNGKLGAGTVTVNSGGTLGGGGRIAGPVTVNSGGILAPGNSPGTLTTGSLLLQAGAVLNYDLGAPGTIGGGVDDLLVVNGNVTLGGTLNIADAGGFAAGTYRLINYTGTLNLGTGLHIGTLPAGFSAAQMSIDASKPGQVDLVVSSGSAATPALALAPSSLNWGSIPVGGSGGVQSVALTNTGTVPVAINSIAAPLPPFVPGGGTCAAPPFTLAAGASCSLAYDFKPTAAGTFSSSPQISSNAPAGPTDVLLSGAAVAATAPALTIAPTNLSWTNVAVGAVGATQSATLTNTGTAALTVNSISAASAPFAANGGTCAAPPFTLAAGAGCSLAYRFKPTAAGGFSSTVSVGSNAPGGTTSFGLNGTTVATAPALAIAPASLSWGSVPVGDSGGTKTVVLGNTGNATLTVNSISAPLAPFVAQSGTCPAPPFTLAVGANCSLAYDFQPGATGSFGATIDLASDAPGNPNSPGPATIALDGAGIVIPQRPPTVAAPATSPAMLFVLALMLGGCGAWLRYRHQAGRDLPSR